MTAVIKLRQTVEFEIAIDDRKGWEFEMEDFDQRLARGEIDFTDSDVQGDFKVLATEVVSRQHKVNYVFDADNKAELFFLLADGERVFESRDHNEIAREWGRRTDIEVNFVKSGYPRQYGTFLDYGDPDKAWDTIKGRN